MSRLTYSLQQVAQRLSKGRQKAAYHTRCARSTHTHNPPPAQPDSFYSPTKRGAPVQPHRKSKAKGKQEPSLSGTCMRGQGSGEPRTRRVIRLLERHQAGGGVFFFFDGHRRVIRRLKRKTTAELRKRITSGGVELSRVAEVWTYCFGGRFHGYYILSMYAAIYGRRRTFLDQIPRFCTFI
jgi:hypothetical protein